MMSYLNNGYDIMNCFAKFEKFLPHSITIPSFMTVESQMPELDQGGGVFPTPHKIGGQNTPYKLGLSLVLIVIIGNRKQVPVHTEQINFKSWLKRISLLSWKCLQLPIITAITTI